jgi:hypothetical protein
VNYVTWAAGLLVLAVAASLLVLRPTGGWKFSVGTKALLRDYIESDEPATVPELQRSLAWHMDDDYGENQRRLAVAPRASGQREYRTPVRFWTRSSTIWQCRRW